MNPYNLAENGLHKVVDDTLGAVEKLEYDRACSSFICTKCGSDYNHHKVESNDQYIEWVFANGSGKRELEWQGQLDCNHCKFLYRINNAIGECLNDCQ